MFADRTFRTIIIFVNILYCLTGLITLSFGVWGFYQAEDIQENVDLLEDFDLERMMISIICIGIAMTLTTILGLKGAIPVPPRRKLLTVYLFIIYGVVMVQLVLGVYVAIFDTGLVNQKVEEKWFVEGPAALNSRVKYQNYFVCCGWNNIYDSRAQPYKTPCPFSAPESCKEKTLELMKENLTPIAITVITFAATQIAALISTAGLLCLSKENTEEEQWI